MTLHEVLTARVERGEFPGIVTLIAHGDDVHVDTIGATAFEGGVPMRRDTIFRIASMTKPVLAALTLVLAQDDLLDLEEPIHRLLPELAGQRVLARPDGPLDETVPLERPVTVEDLLTFRMGTGTIFNPATVWPIVEAAEELQLALGAPEPRTPWEPDEWIRRFATLPLMVQPGTQWQYNTAYNVLGVLLSRAAGKPLGEVLRERLLDPLGMRETGFSLPPERARDLPVSYASDPADGSLTASTATGPEVWAQDPSFPTGAGGLVSTVDEFHSFARMLLNRGVHGGTRLLSEKSVDLMTSNHLTADQIAGSGFLDGDGWGFGVAVKDTNGRYGWPGGYGTIWFNNRRENLVALAFTQASHVLWNGTMTDFERLAYE
ncbi:serine hydrolase domain-containing protein [Winogradskya consettensis]|uniref:Serine hydrolase n=1 Tax=Winogradskya consettensis TaxID=113560 RepID=A0A919SCJ4_9ACTN|nr:serine hydrolase domain-containing protein [Actinoplanes consettensis]GIM69157.1 serine hydrolase [Actinoplanes consettensis]